MTEAAVKRQGTLPTLQLLYLHSLVRRSIRLPSHRIGLWHLRPAGIVFSALAWFSGVASRDLHLAGPAGRRRSRRNRLLALTCIDVRCRPAGSRRHPPFVFERPLATKRSSTVVARRARTRLDMQIVVDASPAPFRRAEKWKLPRNDELNRSSRLLGYFEHQTRRRGVARAVGLSRR